MVYGWAVLNVGTLGKLATAIVLRLGPLYNYPFFELLGMYNFLVLILFYLGVYFYSIDLKEIWNLSKLTHFTAVSVFVHYYVYYSALTKIGFGDAVAVYITAGKWLTFLATECIHFHRRRLEEVTFSE